MRRCAQLTKELRAEYEEHQVRDGIKASVTIESLMHLGGDGSKLMMSPEDADLVARRLALLLREVSYPLGKDRAG